MTIKHDNNNANTTSVTTRDEARVILENSDMMDALAELRGSFKGELKGNGLTFSNKGHWVLDIDPIALSLNPGLLHGVMATIIDALNGSDNLPKIRRMQVATLGRFNNYLAILRGHHTDIVTANETRQYGTTARQLTDMVRKLDSAAQDIGTLLALVGDVERGGCKFIARDFNCMAKQRDTLNSLGRELVTIEAAMNHVNGLNKCLF